MASLQVMHGAPLDCIKNTYKKGEIEYKTTLLSMQITSISAISSSPIFFFYSSSPHQVHVRCDPWLPIQSSSIPDDLSPLPTCLLFPLFLGPLEPSPAIFYVVFIFPLFLLYVPVAIYFDILWFCILST